MLKYDSNLPFGGQTFYAPTGFDSEIAKLDFSKLLKFYIHSGFKRLNLIFEGNYDVELNVDYDWFEDNIESLHRNLKYVVRGLKVPSLEMILYQQTTGHTYPTSPILRGQVSTPYIFLYDLTSEIIRVKNLRCWERYREEPEHVNE